MANEKELIARLKADNKDLIAKLKQSEKEMNSLKNVGSQMGKQIGAQMIGATSKVAILVKGLQSFGKILNAIFGKGIAIGDLQDDLKIVAEQVATQNSLWKSWQEKVASCDGAMKTLREVGDSAASLTTKQEVLEKSVKILRSAYGDLGIALDQTTGKFTGLDEAQAKIARKNAEEAVRHQRQMADSAKRQLDIQNELHQKQNTWWNNIKPSNGKELLRIGMDVSKAADKYAEEQKRLKQMEKDLALLDARQEADRSASEQTRIKEAENAEIDAAKNVADARKALDAEVEKQREDGIREGVEKQKTWLQGVKSFYDRILSGFGFSVKDGLDVFDKGALKREASRARLDSGIQRKLDRAQETGRLGKLTKRERSRLREYYSAKNASMSADRAREMVTGNENRRQAYRRAAEAQARIRDLSANVDTAQRQYDEAVVQTAKLQQIVDNTAEKVKVQNGGK